MKILVVGLVGDAEESVEVPSPFADDKVVMVEQDEAPDCLGVLAQVY